jgi:hypothetical protein
VSTPIVKPPSGLNHRQWVATLDEDAREFYEERAAIREFEAGFPRPLAEELARGETLLYLDQRQQPGHP